MICLWPASFTTARSRPLVLRRVFIPLRFPCFYLISLHNNKLSNCILDTVTDMDGTDDWPADAKKDMNWGSDTGLIPAERVLLAAVEIYQSSSMKALLEFDVCILATSLDCTLTNLDSLYGMSSYGKGRMESSVKSRRTARATSRQPCCKL